MNSYLAICDEVFLVIEDKEIPQDLPFYVGVIRVENGVGKVLRSPHSLKHSIDTGNCWSTLLSGFYKHAGVKNRKTRKQDIFQVIENIKRKLIWNQFVLGFHSTYVKEYVPLSIDEKRLVAAY